MRTLLLFIAVLFFSVGCNRSHKTNYYLSHEKDGIFYYRHHYTLVEKAGDSLKVWQLNDNYNAGYYVWPHPETIPYRTGHYKSIRIQRITESHIECIAYTGKPIRLKRQDSFKEPYRIINIVQQLQIDKRFNEYIQANAKKAEEYTSYVGNRYIPDSNCKNMNPGEFSRYYTAKTKALADSVIYALDNNKKPITTVLLP